MKFLLVLALSFFVHIGCGQKERIEIPEVDSRRIQPEDTDLFPARDSAYYRGSLPADSVCRIRYTTDRDFILFSGNRAVSDRPYPTAVYTADMSDSIAAEGGCRKQPTQCQVVRLRNGFGIAVESERLTVTAEPDWDEIARQVNHLSRHGFCDVIP